MRWSIEIVEGDGQKKEKVHSRFLLSVWIIDWVKNWNEIGLES